MEVWIEGAVVCRICVKRAVPMSAFSALTALSLLFCSGGGGGNPVEPPVFTVEVSAPRPESTYAVGDSIPCVGTPDITIMPNVAFVERWWITGTGMASEVRIYCGRVGGDGTPNIFRWYEGPSPNKLVKPAAGSYTLTIRVYAPGSGDNVGALLTAKDIHITVTGS